MDPPRLGPLADTVARIVIAANDDANGVLQLSAAKVLVSEDLSGSFINVTRTGGLFGDVTVKFKTIPFTARIGKDNDTRPKAIVKVWLCNCMPMPLLSQGPPVEGALEEPFLGYFACSCTLARPLEIGWSTNALTLPHVTYSSPSCGVRIYTAGWTDAKSRAFIPNGPIDHVPA